MSNKVGVTFLAGPLPQIKPYNTINQLTHLKLKPFHIERKLRGVLFIVRAGGNIIKAEFMHTKTTNCLTKLKIGIHLEELK